MLYTGIGSITTPTEILGVMQAIGFQMATNGWTLRSGFADGADNAFAKGADEAEGNMEIYIPWRGFNGCPDNPMVHTVENNRAMEIIAGYFHPAWEKCSDGAKKLHTRNVPQVLGLDLNTLSDLVICWTPNASGSGGTGQAIRIARAFDIPVFDLADRNQWKELETLVQRLESDYSYKELR